MWLCCKNSCEPKNIPRGNIAQRCAEALCRYSSARRVKKAALGLRGRGRSATAPESGKVLLAGLCGFSIEKQGGCPFPKGKKQPPISFSRSLSDESARRLIPILPACRQHSVNIVPIPTFSRRRRFAVEIQFDGPMDPGHIFRFVLVDVDVLPIGFRAAVVIIGILRDEPRIIFEVYIVSKGADVKIFDALRHDDFIDLAIPKCPHLQALQIFGQDQQPFKRGAGEGVIFDHRQLIRQTRGVKTFFVEICRYTRAFAEVQKDSSYLRGMRSPRYR